MGRAGHAVIAQLFWLLIVLSGLYALAFGGRDGALAVAMLVLASVLTIVATAIQFGWQVTNLPVTAVDVLLLLGLGALALRSRRFWPMWVAASQLLVVVTHLASLLAAGFSQRIYAGLATVWAIPCIASMVIGIAVDRRRQN